MGYRRMKLGVALIELFVVVAIIVAVPAPDRAVAGDTGNGNTSSTGKGGVSPISADPAVINGGFETPALAAALPTGAAWVFAENSGIMTNSSNWGITAPDGAQAAYLQGYNGALGKISQVVNLSPGNYSVSFKAVQRNSNFLQPIQVSVDGANVGPPITPHPSAWTLVTTPEFTITTAGNHTLTLAATVANSNGPTSFIDQVSLGTLRSISVSPGDPSVPTYGIRQLKATGNYSNGLTRDLTGIVTWTSSNTRIAKVSVGGLARTLATAGSTTLTAATGGISGSAVLTVTPATLQSISLSPAHPSVAANGIEQFKAVGSYSDGSTQDLTRVATWTSSSTRTATMAAGGRASALAAGSATIQATYGHRGVHGSTGLTVTAAASPQMPTLLDGYVTRPPWKVAGVDFAVGIAGGTVLTDWQTLSGPGIEVSIAGNQVRVDNTSDVTIQNVDFSLHGGATLAFVNCRNITVQNCNFRAPAKPISSVIQGDPACLNFTFRNNVVDGGGSAGNQSGLINYMGSGTTIVRHNWLKHFTQHVLEFTHSPGTDFALDYSFNLILNGAYGEGAHLNYLQWGAGGKATCTVAYNTTVQDFRNVSGGEGFQFGRAPGYPGTLDSPVFSHNVMIASNKTSPGVLTMSTLIHGNADDDVTKVTGTAILDNNYFDRSAAIFVFYVSPRTHSLAGWTVTRNINMVNGKTIHPDNTEYETPPGDPTVD